MYQVIQCTYTCFFNIPFPSLLSKVGIQMIFSAATSYGSAYIGFMAFGCCTVRTTKVGTQMIFIAATWYGSVRNIPTAGFSSLDVLNDDEHGWESDRSWKFWSSLHLCRSPTEAEAHWLLTLYNILAQHSEMLLYTASHRAYTPHPTNRIILLPSRLALCNAFILALRLAM